MILANESGGPGREDRGAARCSGGFFEIRFGTAEIVEAVFGRLSGSPGRL